MNLASVIARWLQDDRPAWEIVEQFERDIAYALTQPEVYPNGTDRTDAPGGYTVPTWFNEAIRSSDEFRHMMHGGAADAGSVQVLR